MGFELMIRYIGLFDTQCMTTLYISLLHTRARAHTLVPTVTSSLPLLGSGFQRRMFPFLSIAELSPASAASFSQQQLTRTEPHDSLTH